MKNEIRHKILLTTINARYSHASLGLRYLYANLHELKNCVEIQEFTIQNTPENIIEDILKKEPLAVGFGIYIWNIELFKKVIPLLKSIAPDIILFAGGPQISFEMEKSPLYPHLDHIIRGEGEITTYKLVKEIIENKITLPKIIDEIKPDLTVVELPYQYYLDHDLKTRNLSVEMSRGCPFGCEFCISSLDKNVRNFPIDKFIDELENLWERGARKFKFIDRTFNLKAKRCNEILDYFLKKKERFFLHFEMIPDHLPVELREKIVKFPKGSLQFEIGIQTFNSEVAKRIGRNQNYSKIDENLKFLMEKTSAHIHADLIVGLPGESLKSIEDSFNKLYQLTNQEIQVGILKRLPGAPIARHTAEYGIIYNTDAPYEIMKSNDLNYLKMMELKRFARFWDLVGNSGNFHKSKDLLLGNSPFANFLNFSNWLYLETFQTHQISLERLSQMVFTFLTRVMKINYEQAYQAIFDDYMATKGRTIPKFLRKDLDDKNDDKNDSKNGDKANKMSGIGRQVKHHDFS